MTVVLVAVVAAAFSCSMMEQEAISTCLVAALLAREIAVSAPKPALSPKAGPLGVALPGLGLTAQFPQLSLAKSRPHSEL